MQIYENKNTLFNILYKAKKLCYQKLKNERKQAPPDRNEDKCVEKQNRKEPTGE